MPKGKVAPKRDAKLKQADSYKHPESESLMRPDVGTQAQFKKKKPAVTYRYDSSLSPGLDWDGQNPAREQGEAAIEEIGHGLTQINADINAGKVKVEEDSAALQALASAREAAEKLRALSKPFLNWAGKAERLSFDVPTLPLFVHERLSTKAIIETLSSHKRDTQMDMYRLFGDPEHSITDQVLRAYEHRDKWVNRMILGDSLVVMNSLLQYESLGGQVQMIYMDPPYGVKFGSNFQPFIRKRDVTNNDDDDMTREPEMVQAYRDTWELGLHSYLTYLRDRLLLARDLLAPSGSVFVQINDENLQHLKEVVDEVFGHQNFVSLVSFRKTSNLTAEFLPASCDFMIWYAKDRSRAKYRPIYEQKTFASLSSDSFGCVEFPDRTWRRLTQPEKEAPQSLPADWKLFGLSDLTSSHFYESPPFKYEGKAYTPKGRFWSTSASGLGNLAKAGRLAAVGDTLRYRRYLSDFPVTTLDNIWQDTGTGTQTADRLYVVQTSNKVVQRCVLMTTDPGDLVLDPTCGGGTTAYVAEQWGRRWITIDTSRVPLALARQRLLTATFPWYELRDEERGPVGGFVYKRKQNTKGEEVGGIVPHVTLKSIANDEPPEEEVLVDRPELDNKVTRVSGPFCVEGTIPTPVSLLAEDEKGVDGTTPTPGAAHSKSHIADSRENQNGYVDRMLEVLRRSPVLHLAGNRTVTLKNIRPPAKTLSLSAEAMVEANGSSSSPEARGSAGRAAIQQFKISDSNAKPVALVFGPENGAISERLVQEGAKEASLKNYTHLYVIGFAIQPNARQLIDNCDVVVGIPATYIQATPDLMMGDLLKNMRSSQIFSVCGLPEIKLNPIAPASSRPDPGNGGATRQYQVELLGLEVFDPVTMDTHHAKGDDVPAWFLDTDYNGLCFHVSQAFFPRTSAWDNLKKALKGEYEEGVWDHLAGTMSAPFEAGQNGQIAVKVIDDRGNELMVVEKLS
jgi:adenine-specific DNA-methyltransferase